MTWEDHSCEDWVPADLSKAQIAARAYFRGVMVKRKTAIREFFEKNGPDFVFPAGLRYATDKGPGEIHCLAGTKGTFLNFWLSQGTWQVWVQTVKGKRHYGVRSFLLHMLGLPDVIVPRPTWEAKYVKQEEGPREAATISAEGATDGTQAAK